MTWAKSDLDSSWYERAQEAAIDQQLYHVIGEHPEVIDPDGYLNPDFVAAVQVANDLQVGYQQWHSARQTPLERAADDVAAHLKSRAGRSK